MMNGIMLITAGVWCCSQILFGHAVARLGIGGSKGSSSGSGGSGGGSSKTSDPLGENTGGKKVKIGGKWYTEVGM